MRLIGNAMNGSYMRNLTEWADTGALEGISLAVAYVASMDEIFKLVTRRKVPLRLWALADGDFPYLKIMRRFREGPPGWQMLLTRDFFHAKIMWFEGVGMYIGSANLTDKAWAASFECGVWLEQAEIAAESLDTRMRAMLDEITRRSSPLSDAHIKAYERIESHRRGLSPQTKALADLVDAELVGIAGSDKPIDSTQGGGGLGEASFVEEWHRALGCLKKLEVEIKKVPWPSWVRPDANPAILQDRATEYWYRREIASSGAAERRIDELYERNRKNPDAAVRAVFEAWSREEAKGDRHDDVNVRPRRMQELLAPHNIERLDEDTMFELISGTHAAHDYALRAPKSDLGDTQAPTDAATRCRLLARYLLSHGTHDDRDVRQVLRYVIWGDRETADVGRRIWRTTSDPNWHIRNLGPNTLGEMVGYARPGEYPPRNGRVSKVLRALGFEGIAV